MYGQADATHARPTCGDGFQHVTGLVGPLVPIYGGSQFRVTLDLSGVSGNFGAKLGFRTAAVSPDVPDAWADSTTVRSSATNVAEDFSLSGATGKMWGQARVSIAASSGVGEATGALSALVDAWDRPLVVASVAVEPSINASQNGYVVVGDRVPALGLAGVMGAIRYTGASGTLGYGLAVRSYTTGAANPSSWTDLFTASNVTADELRNTGSLTVSPGVVEWVEFAMKLSGTDARGNLALYLAGRDG